MEKYYICLFWSLSLNISGYVTEKLFFSSVILRSRYQKRTLLCNPRACKGSIKLLIFLICLLEMWLGLPKNVLRQKPWKVSHQWEWQLLDTETAGFLTCYFIFRRMIKWLNWCTSMVLKGGPSLLNTWKDGLVNSVEKGICNASAYSMIIAIRVYYKN